jgi:hypothetical protein
MVDLSDTGRGKEYIPTALPLNRNSIAQTENGLDNQLINLFELTPVSDKSARGVREYLNDHHPDMISAYDDLCNELNDQGYTLVEKFFKRTDNKAPLIVLEVTDPIFGDYIIPNINQLLEPPYDNLTEQRDSKQKQFAEREQEGDPLDSAKPSAYALERYSASAPLKLVFFAPSESGVDLLGYQTTVPLVMRVVMSAAAEDEAILKAVSRLSGETSDYSYLYDELLMRALREQIHEQSNRFVGIREKPEIVNEKSTHEGNLFSITAIVQQVNSAQEENFKIAFSKNSTPFLEAITLDPSRS